MKDRPELHGQTALRGIAAFVVFIAHVAYFRLFHHDRLFRNIYHIFYWHNEAVDLFFVLSGFILCYVYSQRDFAWRDYFVARFARIYPAYFIATLVFLALLYYDFCQGRGWQGYGFHAVIMNGLLLHNWPGVYVPMLNFPTWSVSVEFFLYLFIFPIVIMAHKHVGFWPKLALIAVLMVIQVVVISRTWKINDEGMDAIWAPFDLWRGVISFTAGFLTCSLGLARGFPVLFSRYVELAVLIVVAGCLMLQFPLSRKIAVGFFPLLAYLAAQDDSVLTRSLKGAFFAWLGHLSYSIYIWHWAMFRISTMALTRLHKMTSVEFFASPFLLIALSAVLVLTVSHCSHFYLERPANRWLRLKLSRAADPLPVALK